MNELESSNIPLLEKEGWTRNQKMDPFRNGAAGVVSSAKLFRPDDFADLTTITASRYRARASRPSAALSAASQLLVDAAASPPLRGGDWSLDICVSQPLNYIDIRT